jgi:hypothetical protein
MQVDVALLCDFVTVRDNLLHILGGGIGELTRPVFPAPMNVGLAVRLLAHPTEVSTSHTVRVLVVGTDGEDIAAMELQTSVVPHVPRPDQVVNWVLPFALHGILLPAPGAYSVEILIDGVHQKSVPFEVKEAPPP